MSSGTGSPAFSNSPMMQAGTLRPSTPSYQPYSQSQSQPQQQQQPAAAADALFGDFDFVSNTGASTGPTSGKISLLSHVALFVVFYQTFPS